MVRKNSFKRKNRLRNLWVPIIIILVIIILSLLVFKFKSSGTGNAVVKGNVFVSDSCLGVRSYGITEDELALCYNKVKNKDITSFSDAKEMNCVDYLCGIYKLTNDPRISTSEKTSVNKLCLNSRINRNLGNYCSNWCYKGITADELGEEDCSKTNTANPNLKSAEDCKETVNVGIDLKTADRCARAFESSTIFSRLNSFSKAESVGCGEYICALYWLSTHKYQGENSPSVYHDTCAKSIGRNGQEFINILSRTRCAAWKTVDKELSSSKNYDEANRFMLSSQYPLLDDGKGGWMYRIENYNTRGSWIFSNEDRFVETFQGFEYTKSSNQQVSSDTAVYQPIILNTKNSLMINYKGDSVIDIELKNFSGTTIARIKTECNLGKGVTTIDSFDDKGNYVRTIYNGNLGQRSTKCDLVSLGYLRDNPISLTPRVGAVDISTYDSRNVLLTKTFTIPHKGISGNTDLNLKFTITSTKGSNLNINVWGLNTDE